MPPFPDLWRLNLFPWLAIGSLVMMAITGLLNRLRAARLRRFGKACSDFVGDEVECDRCGLDWSLHKDWLDVIIRDTSRRPHEDGLCSWRELWEYRRSYRFQGSWRGLTVSFSPEADLLVIKDEAGEILWTAEGEQYCRKLAVLELRIERQLRRAGSPRV